MSLLNLADWAKKIQCKNFPASRLFQKLFVMNQKLQIYMEKGRMVKFPEFEELLVEWPCEIYEQNL